MRGELRRDSYAFGPICVESRRASTMLNLRLIERQLVYTHSVRLQNGDVDLAGRVAVFLPQKVLASILLRSDIGPTGPSKHGQMEIIVGGPLAIFERWVLHLRQRSRWADHHRHYLRLIACSRRLRQDGRGTRRVFQLGIWPPPSESLCTAVLGRLDHHCREGGVCVARKVTSRYMRLLRA